jgi:hypothetical protein
MRLPPHLLSEIKEKNGPEAYQKRCCFLGAAEQTGACSQHYFYTLWQVTHREIQT